MFSFAVRMPLQITTFSSRGKENNDSHTIREVIIAQVEPTIVSDGGENDLRPSSPPHNIPPNTSPAAIVLNYVWRNWLEVSSQPLLYDRSPSVNCISDDDDELDGEVETSGETRALFSLVRVSCSAFISGMQGVGHIHPP